MSEPRKLAVGPQEIGYPEITVPADLAEPLARAERTDSPEDWDALHMACCSHIFPRPAFTADWETHYSALAYLSKVAMVRMRAGLVRRMLRPEPPANRGSFDAQTSEGSF